MKVEENGWPTFPGALARDAGRPCSSVMVSAVHDFRGTYNVTDYRWFNLRDGDTLLAPAVPALRPVRQRLRARSRPSPSTGAWSTALARREAAPTRRRPRLALRALRAPRGRSACAARPRSPAPDRRLVRARPLPGRRPPLPRSIAAPRSAASSTARIAGGSHRHVVRAAVRLRDGRLVRLRRRVPGPAASGSARSRASPRAPAPPPRPAAAREISLAPHRAQHRHVGRLLVARPSPRCRACPRRPSAPCTAASGTVAEGGDRRVGQVVGDRDALEAQLAAQQAGDRPCATASAGVTKSSAA